MTRALYLTGSIGAALVAKYSVIISLHSQGCGFYRNRSPSVFRLLPPPWSGVMNAARDGADAPTDKELLAPCLPTFQPLVGCQEFGKHLLESLDMASVNVSQF